MSVAQGSAPSTREQHGSEDYTIGIICALPIELAAAVKMLDKEHPRLLQDPGDDNSYRFGHIGNHNVVIGCLAAGRTGLVSAASVALKMKSSFRCVRFGLMVGIGGGVPSDEHDIRLGDVVISKPAGQHGGVVQYDLGKTRPNGNFERTGSLAAPPDALLTTLTDVIAAQEMDELNIAAHLSQLAQRLPAYGFPAKLTDDLYLPNHLHKGGKTCLDCGKEDLVQREERPNKIPAIHYGTIASGNRVMKDAVERDVISQALGGVLCFEMEAAGLMNNFPCLVIRGISDYSDSHKNDGWQRYAAATAAAFAKELLNHLAATQVAQIQTISQAMNNLSSQLANNTDVTQQTGEKIDRAMEREVLAWLSPPINLTSIQNDTFDRRTKHTGEWLFGDPRYLGWYESGGLFWIHGVAGCGKTLLREGREEGLHWYRFTAQSANRCVTAQAIETVFGDPPAESSNLHEYAREFWPAHARQNDAMPGFTASDELRSRIDSLFETANRKKFIDWLKIYHPDEIPGLGTFVIAQQPLYFASLLGFQKSVATFWQSCSQLDQDEGSYGNALNAAACMGHADTVMWLTDHIDNPPDYFYLPGIVRYLRRNVAQTLRALLQKGPKTAISADLVYSMVMNSDRGEILRICLEEDLTSISITKELIKAATHKKWNSRIVEVLVKTRTREFPVDLWTLLTIADVSLSALQVLINSKKRDIHFDALDHLTFAEQKSTYATQELLNLGVAIPITTELINALAASPSGSRILNLLLDEESIGYPLSKSDVLTVARGFNLGTFESLLKHDWEDNNLTEELILAIAFNCYLDPPAAAEIPTRGLRGEAKIPARGRRVDGDVHRIYRPTHRRSSENQSRRALISLLVWDLTEALCCLLSGSESKSWKMLNKDTYVSSPNKNMIRQATLQLVLV
ncbi:pfs domain-containing protein, partial [Aureobasidium melanogenum]